MTQLGAEYSNPMDFKRKAKQAFKKVMSVYPGLDMEDAEGGFIIKRGRTAIVRQKSKRNLSDKTR